MQEVLEMNTEQQEALKQALGIDMVLTDPDAMQRFCRDFPGDVEYGAVAVLRPRSTEEVSLAVKASRALGLGIIPQGGNTGLVQGGVPDGQSDVVILSLERMNRIRQVDPDDFSAIVEAGCILLEMKNQLAAQGMFFAGAWSTGKLPYRRQCQHQCRWRQCVALRYDTGIGVGT